MSARKRASEAAARSSFSIASRVHAMETCEMRPLADTSVITVLWFMLRVHESSKCALAERPHVRVTALIAHPWGELRPHRIRVDPSGLYTAAAAASISQ